MRRRVRWRDRRNGSFWDSASQPVRRSSAPLRRRPWIGLATNPGDHATGKRRQHGNDDGGTGAVYAGLAQLFRLLRNARSANRLNPLGPVATQGGFVAAVENPPPSPGDPAKTRGS